jgi:hypothetical protein
VGEVDLEAVAGEQRPHRACLLPLRERVRGDEGGPCIGLGEVFERLRVPASDVVELELPRFRGRFSASNASSS